MPARYYAVPIPGTSAVDHLNYEIEEHLQTEGYSSAAAARNAWLRACRRANDQRRRNGYDVFARPFCRVEHR